MNIVFQPELVDPSAFIAPTATVLGNVSIGPSASIWFGAVVRGDCEAIEIGGGTNVQDLAVLHADPGLPCVLGRRVTVGHAAVVHGATVEQNVLIGIRAVVLNGARIGTGSIIAAGAVVAEGVEVPPGSVVMGIPGRIRRKVNDEDLRRIQHAADHYVQAAETYHRQFKPT